MVCKLNEKGNEMNEQQMLQMYGMNEDDIRVYYMDSITAKFSGLEMVVAGILSDCQELVSMSNDKDRIREQVRQQMNVAKFILFEMMDARREEETVLVSSDGTVIG
jgi:hypothetical protein